MSARVRNAAVFDAIGTLFQLRPLEEKLGGKTQLDAWFERLLHTATALTLAGDFRRFAELAESTLKTVLARTEVDAVAADVLDELEKLPPYPDAGEAFELLRQANVAIAVLTNGGEQFTRTLLEAAGLDELVVEIVSVEEIELYKPHPAAYRHAAERIGVDVGRATLIAAHAWDVIGAKAAGMNAIWVDRFEREWPLPRGKPRRAAADLEQAARLLVERL